MNTKPQPPRSGKVGIIALVPDPWSPVWMDRHHVLSRLAGYFHVVWMYQPGWRQIISDLSSGRSHPMSYPKPEGMYVYQPRFWLPRLGRPAWLARYTAGRRLKHVYDYLCTQGCTKVVLYLWGVEYSDALGQVPHDFSLYNVSDEYSFSTTEVPVSAAERNLIETVGQVFIISPALMEKKGHFNPNTEFIPCGVDYWRYATPRPQPEDLSPIPHPRIGYLGHLKRMVDWALLLELSAAHPEWSFVFVGPKRPHPDIDEALKQMSDRPNVHFLGGKPADRLGDYIQHFDVCTMPYRMDDYTKYIYPGKMHEYLASGRPVVSTPIRSVEEFGHVIALATNCEEWSDAIARSLSAEENSPERRLARQSVAHEYDWEPRVHKIACTIAQRLGLAVPDAVLSFPSKPREIFVK